MKQKNNTVIKKGLAAGRKSLSERYNDLNKEGQQAFRDFCETILKVSTETLYRWMRGKDSRTGKAILPPAIYQGLIAAYFGTSATMIFYKASKTAAKSISHAK